MKQEWRSAIKTFLEVKKSKHLAFLSYFSEVEMEECDQKNRSVYRRFGIVIRYSLTYLLEVGACVSLKVATKDLLEVKKLLRLRFLDYFFKAETEKYNQEDWNISDTFGIITLLLPTYHLEVGVPFSVKLATKASFESKKTFLNEKWRSATKKNQVYLINFECFCLA